MSKVKTGLITCASLSVLLAAGYGVRQAMRSPQFLVRVVEVADLPDDAPIDSQAIVELAKVSIGRENLFQLDLDAIEKRMIAHPWVREVRLQKRFPQTLSITVDFREPQAVFQGPKGELSYVDRDGTVFSRLDLSRKQDLPLLNGFPDPSTPAGQDQLKQALFVLRSWEQAPLAMVAQISSLAYDSDRGIRAVVAYSLQRTQQLEGVPLPGGKGRAIVDLGSDFEVDFDGQLTRLNSVFKYLSGNGILARQVFADAGKKIVVKIARGS